MKFKPEKVSHFWDLCFVLILNDINKKRVSRPLRTFLVLKTETTLKKTCIAHQAIIVTPKNLLFGLRSYCQDFIYHRFIVKIKSKMQFEQILAIFLLFSTCLTIFLAKMTRNLMKS